MLPAPVIYWKVDTVVMETTYGNQIIDGAGRVKIYGEAIQVKANIHTIGGFSAHADQSELLAWHQQTGNPKTTFLVHGEEKSMHILGLTK